MKNFVLENIKTPNKNFNFFEKKHYCPHFGYYFIFIGGFSQLNHSLISPFQNHPLIPLLCYFFLIFYFFWSFSKI